MNSKKFGAVAAAILISGAAVFTAAPANAAQVATATVQEGFQSVSHPGPNDRTEILWPRIDHRDHPLRQGSTAGHLSKQAGQNRWCEQRQITGKQGHTPGQRFTSPLPVLGDCHQAIMEAGQRASPRHTVRHMNGAGKLLQPGHRGPS